MFEKHEWGARHVENARDILGFIIAITIVIIVT